ncbi:hypothetical protein SLNWT_1464 [Streptomyces albus]|uniref:Uncharacterized protein n=1 Tax=Streptomyces albus (strain ATCC 21838 / DSM 41398 / FERM P-419 / JCM 4703 / NBRC 107858) TaxID=1081613 RepID=A0A0B5ERF2_STRA4|nr:hypothetical protein SLNWT_1464 [Streptomyces albus]AOU76156.1 hypothetical protein SLNHY_1465 [Streptomyces albus]AYN31947.1 hypothetical protein DUI70_1444 [Streptomyces albus]
MQKLGECGARGRHRATSLRRGTDSAPASRARCTGGGEGFEPACGRASRVVGRAAAAGHRAPAGRRP